MYELADKVAVVTGGTRGIGLAIAGQILAAGGRVMLGGRRATEGVQALVASHGADRVAFEAGDIAVPEQATRLVETAGRQFGRIDMLIHAAGVQSLRTFETEDPSGGCVGKPAKTGRNRPTGSLVVVDAE